MREAETKTAVFNTRQHTRFFNREKNFFIGRDSHFFTPNTGGSTVPQLKSEMVAPVEGEKLLAHTPPRTTQQTAPSPQAQRRPQSVDDCLKQKDGDLLPSQVGLVEQINRDVGLEEVLGKDRAVLENQIRQSHDARKFVCEAGVSAVLALYFNRDYKKRLHVARARKSLSLFPDYYTLTGFDKIKQTKELLEKKYRIHVERGNKAWSPRDIVLLAEALGKLTENEIPLIGDYHFIRWTNRCDQLTAQNPDYSCELSDYGTCGLHETDVIYRRYTITMYDCMGGEPDDEIKPGYNVQPGAETILHEIGHAMEFGRTRLAMEKAFDAKKAYARLKKQLEAATTTAEKASIEKKLKAAEKVKDDTEAELDKALDASPLKMFKKLIKGKKPLTAYATTNESEAFAEAYMLFKVAPDKLKKLNKALFNWFNQGGFL